MNGEFSINFWLKVIYGTFVFWLIYNVFNISSYNFSQQFLYLVFIMSLSSVFSVFLAYITLTLFNNWVMRGHRKSFWEVNKFPLYEELMYEEFSILLQSLLIASGLVLYLGKVFIDLLWFFIVYIFVVRGFSLFLAYRINNKFKKNIMYMLTLNVIFFVSLFYSILVIMIV